MLCDGENALGSGSCTALVSFLINTGDDFLSCFFFLFCRSDLNYPRLLVSSQQHA